MNKISMGKKGHILDEDDSQKVNFGQK